MLGQRRGSLTGGAQAADPAHYLNGEELSRLDENERVVQQAGRLGTLLRQRASLMDLIDEHCVAMADALERMNEADEEMAALEEEREAELHGTDLGAGADYEAGEITGRSGGLITGRTSARSGMPSPFEPRT